MKMRGFTLVELLVVMLMTAIVLTVVLELSRVIFGLERGVRLGEKERGTRVELYEWLRRDLRWADMLRVEEKGVWMRGKRGIIRYRWERQQVVREQMGRRDTVAVRVMKVQLERCVLRLFYGQDGAEVMVVERGIKRKE